LYAVGQFPFSLPGIIVPLALTVCASPAAAFEDPRARPALGLLEAVRITLTNDPNIQLQEAAVHFSRGSLQEAKGRFDSRLAGSISQGLEQTAVQTSDTNALNPGGFQRLTVDRTTARASVYKQFRSGLEVSPGVQYTQFDDNNKVGLEPESRAEVNFTVRVPLGRGLGRKDVAAEETAARINLEASKMALRNVIAASVLNTAASYWNYRAATLRLQILQQSENRARELINNTLQLVKANEVPPAETNQLAANVADKVASRIAAEQELIEARHTLGLSMGVSPDTLAQFSPPTDEFPEPSDQVQELAAHTFIQLALAQRTDLQSARLREGSARTMVDAAHARLKPQADLLLQAGYGGVAVGGESRRFVGAFSDNIEGVSGFLALNFSWPPANNAARGILVQQEALYEQALLRADDLARHIASGVEVSLERLRREGQALKETASAIAEYQIAVKNEQIKRQLGLSDFLNVVALEDRSINASLAHLTAQLQHAVALARFRYETGLLMAGDAQRISITLEQFVSLPSAKSAIRQP
jgi:outer membrane protein TolC